MITRRFTVPIVICMLLAPVAAIAADSMTHEESIVRNAYAKLSYAVDIETVYHATKINPSLTTDSLAKQVSDEGLRFTLSNFRVGQLSDIVEDNFIQHFPQYADDGKDVVHTGRKTHNYSESNGPSSAMETLTVNWGPAVSSNGAGDLVASYKVSQMIPILQDELGVSPLLRYCSYTVTVKLAGRSRTYQAAFFFGPNNQAAALDPIVGGDGNNLQYFTQHPVYPQILLGGSLMAQKPVVRSFLAANQKAAPSCKSGDACCDAATLQCGVLSSDLGRQP